MLFRSVVVVSCASSASEASNASFFVAQSFSVFPAAGSRTIDISNEAAWKQAETRRTWAFVLHKRYGISARRADTCDVEPDDRACAWEGFRSREAQRACLAAIVRAEKPVVLWRAVFDYSSCNVWLDTQLCLCLSGGQLAFAVQPHKTRRALESLE